MSIHIKLAATATGDAITAISTTVKVAKDADVEIDLLIQNINIRVRPTSDVQDIIEIYRLKSNCLDMNRIQLHKSIQHVTTANGKLSDKTIKLINKMAKKAYGSK